MALPAARQLKQLTQWALSRLPAAPNGGRSIASDYPDIVREIERKFKLQSRVEWDSHGQGYASFVDAWFYQDTPEFRLPSVAKGSHEYLGLYVLLCRAAPYYVIGQGSKSWTDRGGSSYLPSYSGIDVLPSRAVQELSVKVEALLSARGLVRLHPADVAEELPPDLCFDTNLTDGPHRLYDALFFWYD